MLGTVVEVTTERGRLASLAKAGGMDRWGVSLDKIQAEAGHQPEAGQHSRCTARRYNVMK